MAKKKFIGIVVSDKMSKTVVVSVEIRKKMPKYEKIVKRNKRFKAHDNLDVRVGDKVKIEECRPYSKDKRWKVVEIVK